MEIDPAPTPPSRRLILIVAGAHLRAELADRPLAYRLRQSMLDWLGDAYDGDAAGWARAVVVCSDLWYLNHDDLRACPTVSIGAPGVNALSAYLADKVPSALAIENVLLVQMDVELTDLVACCWGVSTPATLSAVDAFTERYLDQFMRAATREWE